jgi:hypothetical protein
MMRLVLHIAFLSDVDAWGWLGAALLAMLIAIPYFRIRGMAGPVSKASSANSELPTQGSKRGSMRVHYWLAPMVAIVSLVHAWIPMSSGRMPHTSMNGLWLATYALGALFLQLFVGLLTRYAGPRRAAAMRRVHFGLMLVVVVLLVSHLWLNG